METTTLLSWASGIITALAYLPYILAILEEGSTVRPNRASWFVWWVIDATSVAALLAAGAYMAIPMFAAFTIGSTAVLYLSIKRGEGGFEKLDLTCVSIAAIGIWLWISSGDPVLAIFALMVAAVAGTMPTILKSWRNPLSEDFLTWAIFTSGGFLGVMAIDSASFAAFAPPFNIFFLQVMILTPLALNVWRKWRHDRSVGMYKSI